MVWVPPRTVIEAGPIVVCFVAKHVDSDRHCGNRVGDHTALGYPICDECFEAVAL